MSIPFFYEPGCDANINTKIPRALLPAGGDTSDSENDSYYPFASFLLNKLPIYTEYAAICDNLPDWMRKKYLDSKPKIGCWATKSGIEVDGKNYAKRIEEEAAKQENEK